MTNDQQRYELIRGVESKELTIKDAARINGIKYTTAKIIMKIYRKEGRIDKKKRRVCKQDKDVSRETKRKMVSPVQSYTDYATSPPISIRTGEQLKLNALLDDSFWVRKMTEHFI